MSESLEAIKKQIDECSDYERLALKRYLQSLQPHALEAEWGIESDLILSAIRRSSDLTKRGVRGIIAEAVFESEIVPEAIALGWASVDITEDLPYDVLLRQEAVSARIQIKLQRLERGTPKLFYPKHYQAGSLYVVEVQKTRGGERPAPVNLEPNADTAMVESAAIQTRPYRFGDFDILAVNMHPSTGNWKNFRYTLSSWLIPRRIDESLIEIFQPVSSTPNDVWTDSLIAILEWLREGKKRSVLTGVAHIRKPRKL